MGLRDEAASLVGEWSGHNKLWLGPGEPVRESSTDATVTMAAGERFLVLTYNWFDEGKAHDGVLMVRLAQAVSAMDMVWVDSFHTSSQFMRFEGKARDDGGIEGSTKWTAGSEEWGWRIVISSPNAQELVVRMYIESPAGEEAPAVESIYSRRATAA